nr:MAG: triple gene block protein 2 [Xinjiang betaflexivirus 2]
MPLSPPIDYSRVFIVVAVGLSIGLALYTLTRSTLPHVGDNIHSLPHGGRYRDGTKSIDYCSPQRNFPSSNLFRGGSLIGPSLIIAVVVCAILVSERFGHRTPACVNCG